MALTRTIIMRGGAIAKMTALWIGRIPKYIIFSIAGIHVAFCMKMLV